MSMDLNYAEGWRPDEGDTIIGHVTDVSVGYSNFGGSYPIVTVKPEDGGDERAIHCFHTGLRARMMELKPNVGERIGVQYKGKRPVKNDPTREVAVYVVKVDGRDGGNAWATLDGAQAPPQPAQRTDVPVSSEDFGQPVLSPQDADDDIPF